MAIPGRSTLLFSRCDNSDPTIIRHNPMATRSKLNARVPVVCVHRSAFADAELFNPNLWPEASRGLIQSCWTEYSVLRHCVEQLVAICKEREKVCQGYVTTIQQQWSTEKLDLEKLIIYGQHPDLHIHIEAFFSGIKSLLDLLVQVLSTEKIVRIKLRGFQRVRDNYGGTVLNALENNTPNIKKEVAARIHSLISEHKGKWIDKTIFARDQLIHPEKGMHQLMFHLVFSEKDGKLVCQEINAPTIESESIDEYAQRVLEFVQTFTSNFIKLVKVVV